MCARRERRDTNFIKRVIIEIQACAMCDIGGRCDGERNTQVERASAMTRPLPRAKRPRSWQDALRIVPCKQLLHGLRVHVHDDLPIDRRNLVPHLEYSLGRRTLLHPSHSVRRVSSASLVLLPIPCQQSRNIGKPPPASAQGLRRMRQMRSPKAR